MARKYRDAIRLIQQDGWYYSYSTGGHDHYRHAVKRGKVTVDGRPGEDIRRKRWAYIMRQAGLRERYS